MWQNTSIIPDENLAHRMGLIPLAVDPRHFEYKDANKGYDYTNSLRFKLHVKCSKKTDAAPVVLDSTHNESQYYHNSNVFSGDLEWIPIGMYSAQG